MLTTVFATKIGMTQAWTKGGKRMPVTRCQVTANKVVGQQKSSNPGEVILEIGFGQKKLANNHKPLRTRLERSGFTSGVARLQGVHISVTPETLENVPKVGQTIVADQVLTVGDVVHVQGTSKGRGFAGAMKRHGFSGGQRTHGQSDRARAVGSIGAGTTPGRVFKGKRMPGHFGVDTVTIKGLVVLHVDAQTGEVWLSGPIPGAMKSIIRIEKTGETRGIELFNAAPAVEEVVAEPVAEETVVAEAMPEESAAPAEAEVAA